MSVAEALQRLQAAADDGRLDRLGREHGVRLLTVHGSALDDPDEARDLDLAVALEPGSDLVALVNALIDLTGTDAVDVMVLDGASPTARRNGLSGALPLLQAEPGLFARTQMAAVLEFFETAEMRRLSLEQMAAG